MQRNAAWILCFAVAAMLGVTIFATPSVSAHSSGAPASPVRVVTMTPSQLQAAAQKLASEKVDPEILAEAEAYLSQHPFQGHITYYDKDGQVINGPHPYVSWGFGWGYVTIYLSENDVHNIWDLIWTVGLAGAGAALCSPGLWLAALCAVVGAVIGYIVAESIWNWAAWNCGFTVTYYYTNNTYSGSTWDCQ